MVFVPQQKSLMSWLPQVDVMKRHPGLRLVSEGRRGGGRGAPHPMTKGCRGRVGRGYLREKRGRQIAVLSRRCGVLSACMLTFALIIRHITIPIRKSQIALSPLQLVCECTAITIYRRRTVFLLLIAVIPILTVFQ